MSTKPALCIQWFGHSVGLLASLFFLVFLIGEGAPEFAETGSIPGELLLFLPLLAIAVAGCVVALFRMRTGGAMQLAGGAAMATYHLISGGIADIGAAAIFGVPFIVCGGIMLALWRYEKSSREKRIA